MAHEQIVVSDEDEAERAEAARRAARDKERKKSPIKMSKIPLPKDHRSEKNPATPKGR